MAYGQDGRRGGVGAVPELHEWSSHPRWQYVEVEATIHASGVAVPRVVVWPDGRRFKIDSVTRCAHKNAQGGELWCYEAVIAGQKKRLWYTHGAFFVQVEQGGVECGSMPPAWDLNRLRKECGFRW